MAPSATTRSPPIVPERLPSGLACEVVRNAGRRRPTTADGSSSGPARAGVVGSPAPRMEAKMRVLFAALAVAALPLTAQAQGGVAPSAQSPPRAFSELVNEGYEVKGFALLP